MFWRLKCHACGRPSQYKKGSGITQFQCSDCLAWSYLDQNGEYTDPPAHIIQQEEAQPYRGRQHDTSSSSQKVVFCDTCLHNQQINHQLLSEYLPDEDHPKYARYLKELPKYKQELEHRYPQICQDCAPKAQSIIHNADYYSMTNNAGRLLGRTRGGRRSMSPEPVQSRDTFEKSLVRKMLGLVGVVFNVSALLQLAWHAYGIVALQQDLSIGGRLWDRDYRAQMLSEEPKLSQCVERLSRRHFDYPCYRSGTPWVWTALITTLCLIWYNPGLRQLYNPSIRIASVIGWKLHFGFMVFVLAARGVALYYLQELLDFDFSKDGYICLHVLAITAIVAGHALAGRSIELEKWKVKGSIMPRPEERDVLSQFAGPARETFTPQVSLTAPGQLLARQAQAFPIENLAPHRRTPQQRRQLPPSPPGSIGDPMDIEPIAPAQQPTLQPSSFGRSTGWDTVRTNLFSIDDELRSRQQQGRNTADDDKHMYIRPQTQTNAFKARLPQAPMSQERKMRNPISQVPQFREVPATQRQDFLQQMRSGIDRGKGFFRERSVDSDTSELTTATTRTRGQLDLAQSDWHLPGDIDKATGLEDMFGGTFKIQDHTEHTPKHVQSSMSITPGQRRALVAVASIGASLVVVFNIGNIWRPICLFLVRVLELMGY